VIKVLRKGAIIRIWRGGKPRGNPQGWKRKERRSGEKWRGLMGRNYPWSKKDRKLVRKVRKVDGIADKERNSKIRRSANQKAQKLTVLLRVRSPSEKKKGERGGATGRRITTKMRRRPGDSGGWYCGVGKRIKTGMQSKHTEGEPGIIKINK